MCVDQCVNPVLFYCSTRNFRGSPFLPMVCRDDPLIWEKDARGFHRSIMKLSFVPRPLNPRLSLVVRSLFNNRRAHKD